MRLEQKTRLPITADQAVSLLTSEAYSRALAAQLTQVSAIEEIARVSDGDVMHRTTRYTAPTAGRIPRFLKKYEAKAPAEVSWEERAVWDLAKHTMHYTIVPDLPQRWHSYYNATGTLSVTPSHDGDAMMRASLSFEVKVLGLGKLIEAALREEVQRILQIQGEAALRQAAQLA